MQLRELCAIRSASEQAILESLLMWHEIDYLIHNDHFGSLEVGPVIPTFNQKRVLVAAVDLERARELLGEPQGTEPGNEVEVTTAGRDRVRMVLETLLFGWFVPGRGPVGSRRPAVGRRPHES